MADAVLPRPASVRPPRPGVAGPTRADAEALPVVITGIAGRLGRRLVRRLHRERPVVGVDLRPFPDRPKDVEVHALDLRRKRTQDLFRGRRFAAVVHLGILHDPRASATEHHTWNVAGFQRLLGYVAQYEIPKLLVLSSANVYGPRPDNPQYLTEEAPLLAAATFSDMRDLVEVDMLAQAFHWQRRETETVILRPVHILGAVRNAPSNYLRLPVVPTLLGFDPLVQVIHQDDVIEAIALALRPGARGVFNVAGPAAVPLSRLIEAAGKPRLPVPHLLARGMLARLFKFRATSFPAPELDFIRYVCMVDDARAREALGFRPRHDLAAAVAALDAPA